VTIQGGVTIDKTARNDVCLQKNANWQSNF